MVIFELSIPFVSLIWAYFYLFSSLPVKKLKEIILKLHKMQFTIKSI